MKTLIMFVLGVFPMGCTSSEETSSQELPQQIQSLQDDEPYTVHSFTEVGGDEFRRPYLECVEEILFGENIKDSWDEEMEFGKCPDRVAQKNNNKYNYVAYCDRLKFHVYRSEQEVEGSITMDTVKKACTTQLVH